MKTNKTWRALGLLLGLTWLFSAPAQAATSDSLTVTITPNAAYALDIDTASVVLNLGTVDLGASTQTVTPATVTIQSSYATTDITILGQVISGGWTLDANTASDESDALKAWAVFTDTSVATMPTSGVEGAFSGTVPGANGSDVIDDVVLDVGTDAGGDLQFVKTAATAGYKSMEDMPPALVDGPASKSHLWLRFTLPPATTTLTAKQVYLTLTAGAPN
jgi:hypothetical protein